ncbi:hypothetical protein OGAPHI_004565 [Ogataea philodendri]|uniref:Ribosomal protein L5 C-terminal domain-containing protein n=1 Tax=Ogataea philodendri TaxID=1378263 RepID=A0A9P8P3X2_9ASCO|nr:uncharacterized protein OGAPHI_004565 [Ogataea philodendri]KAH3664214.1 hypothetical protein OGAPHI_004565 [Ogataea philodendri]
MSLVQLRHFSHTAVAGGKPGCSLVKPVHHRVAIDKRRLSPRFPELKYSPTDIRSPKFHPKLVKQDRLNDHYHNTLASDLLLINYKHDQKDFEGVKRRKWDMTSPYHINRPLQKPKGQVVPSPGIEKRTWKNVPRFEAVTINCFVDEAKANPAAAIAAQLQLQQITGVKVTPIYAKTNVPTWKLRPGMVMGGKVRLTGLDAHQFVSTLTELVLPRAREFRGINNTTGDQYGNIAFGISSETARLFPEIEYNQDSWPQTYGFWLTLHTSAQLDYEARTLLSGFGFPFYGNEKTPLFLRQA